MMKRVLFAAGGTMGHLGPAIAVADELRRRAPMTPISFIGTGSGIEAKIKLEYPSQQINKVPLPRKFGPAALLFPLRLLIAVAQALPMVRSAGTVVGFGGYVATPVYIAARLLRRRIILHEANALPGFANRLGRRLGAECFVNFESVGRRWHCRAIGMPLHPQILAAAQSKERSALSDGREKILVMGGSQGSMRINEAIWSALPRLSDRYQVRHSVGAENIEKVPKNISGNRYQPTPFIEDMAAAYQWADLVIARAGAVTCAELMALGKRAILVPLEIGNGEQSINARAVAEIGNAIVVADERFTAEWLVENLAAAFELLAEGREASYLEATEIMVESILARGKSVGDGCEGNRSEGDRSG